MLVLLLVDCCVLVVCWLWLFDVCCPIMFVVVRCVLLLVCCFVLAVCCLALVDGVCCLLCVVCCFAIVGCCLVSVVPCLRVDVRWLFAAVRCLPCVV